MTTATHRPISFLKKVGDIEWLATKRCPKCRVLGKLQFGMHPRELLTCNDCGHKFKIKGRRVR